MHVFDIVSHNITPDFEPDNRSGGQPLGHAGPGGGGAGGVRRAGRRGAADAERLEADGAVLLQLLRHRHAGGHQEFPEGGSHGQVWKTV